MLRGDYISFVAKQALAGEDYKTHTPVELAKKQPGPLTQNLRNSRQELLEMFLSRVVDNFQIYLVDVIRLVLKKEPRILSEQKPAITLGHILKFDSIETLTQDILETKLNSLAYEGYSALEKWCADKSIPLAVSSCDRPKIVELIALRNIIVHTRGTVDHRYKSAAPASTFTIGQKRELEVDDLSNAVQLLDSITAATDEAMALKFQIERSDIEADVAARSKKRWANDDGTTSLAKDVPQSETGAG